MNNPKTSSRQKRRSRKLHTLYKNPVFFIDKVSIRLGRRRAEKIFYDLRRAAGRIKSYKTSYRPKESLLSFNVSHDWPQRFERITRLLDQPHIFVTSLELACDFIGVRGIDAAKRIIPTLVVRWGSSTKVVTFGSSTYWARRGSPRILTAYYDRPSKLNPDGAPILHLELRIKSRALDKANLRNPSDLLSLLDPEYHRQLWRHHIRQCTIDPRMYYLVLNGTPKAKRKRYRERLDGPPYDWQERLGKQWICDAVMEWHIHPKVSAKAQAVALKLRHDKLRPNSVFSPSKISFLSTPLG